jgi:hypothetical protein
MASPRALRPFNDPYISSQAVLITLSPMPWGKMSFRRVYRRGYFRLCLWEEGGSIS